MSRLHLDIRRWTLGIVALLACGLQQRPVQSVLAAQPEPPPPEATVYTVQPGDTLFGIAQQFGVSVDALAAANGLDDPGHINVGQRLIIPVPVESAEEVLVHAVEPGEALWSISLHYGLSPLELAAANHMLRSDTLFLGGTLNVPQHAGDHPPPCRLAHYTGDGETLASLALRYDTSPWALAAANGVCSPFLSRPGHAVWVPAETEVIDWPDPFAGFQIHPTPAVQGRTLSIGISLTLPVSLTGSFHGTPQTFFSTPGAARALTGIDALSETGIRTLVVTASLESGALARYVQRILVVPGEYSEETVTISEDVAAALTPQVVQSEAEFLDQLFLARTPSRLWQGRFVLPSPGDITSAFGTRRHYNLQTSSSYHTGTDLFVIIGTPVYAPADGVVVAAEPLTVRGNIVIIDHGWGVMSGFWHLSEILVEAGETVVRGQQVGSSGSTGLSTGPHLHWEMRVGGVPVDALQWVNEEFP